MSSYIPPIEDMDFLLREVFDFDAAISALPGYEDMNSELAISVLDQGGKFCANVIAPLNRAGDEEGCRLEDGGVITPKGFPKAYRAFVGGRLGWTIRRSGLWRARTTARPAGSAR